MSNNSYLSSYAKSFNWAGFFLPKKTYLKCSTLYDFCRTIDNIADDSETLNIKKNKFLNFKSDFVNKKFDNPIIKKMWELVEEYQISTKIIEDLFDGIESDLKDKVEITSDKEITLLNANNEVKLEKDGWDSFK